MKKKISITIEESVLNQIDSIVDNLYIRNRSQAIEYLAKNALGEQKTAIILAGGDEERLRIDGEYMLSAQVKGKTVLEHAISKLRESGFKDIYIIARENILTRAFEILKDGTSFGVKVNYIEEKVSKGTAATLREIKGKVNSRFLAVYGDIVFTRVNLQKLWEAHMKTTPLATLMLTTSPKPSEKATIRMEGDKLLEFIQKPKKSDVYLVFSPVFVAEPELLDYPGNALEREVFPKLATKGLLRGYISSEKEFHIHCVEDTKKVVI